MQLTGNTILITGGTSGIGLGLAEALHKRGNTVIVAGRRQPQLDAIVAAHPGMHGMKLDVADPGALDVFALDVRKRFPSLNVLVNNAGISGSEDLTGEAIDVSAADSIIHTNILGVLHLTATLLPTLRRQPQSTIITTTSGLAFVPFAPFPTYCATKAFLHSWLQSLRFQLRNTSVEVLELVPPYVQTELSGAQQATDPHAMPLADYIVEVMQILGDGSGVGNEILVERVKLLRWAEQSGKYDQIFSAHNNR
jgi:uncharacterized oxidoreductase